MRPLTTGTLLAALLASTLAHAAPPEFVAPAVSPVPALHTAPPVAPPPLAQSAAEHVRPQATKILSHAQQEATTLRTRATQPEVIKAEQTKAVRHDMAEKIVLQRRELRLTNGSLKGAQEQHAAGAATLQSTTAELKTAEIKVAEAKAGLPWLGRVSGMAITSSARLKLGRYEDEKAAYELLAGRLTDETHQVETLAADVKSFENKRATLATSIATQRGRDWKGEASNATDAELASLKTQADRVETDAKKEIHTLVSSWVKDKVAPQRTPVARVHEESEAVMAEATHTASTISDAHTSVRRASDAVRQKQSDDLFESTFGDNPFSQIAGTVDRFSVSNATSTAQEKLQRVDRAVGTLNGKVANLRKMVASLKVDAPGLEGAAARVDADVATVAFVDLALNFAHMDSGLMEIGFDMVEQGNLGRAATGLSRTSSKVEQIRENVKQIHAQLGGTLASLDKEAAKVVDTAVADLVAQR